jgi:dihydrolipoamide dehydrogenase
VGCIPSKALLHASRVINETEEMARHGVDFGKPAIDLKKLGGWKDKVVGQLTGGLASMAKQRKVQVVTGKGTFAGPNRIEVETGDGKKTVDFKHAVIAAGSEAVKIPDFPHDDPRVFTSTGALRLEDIPKRLLVIGGGIIGLEMATVYDSLGSKVTVVELMDGLIPGCDRDLVKPLEKIIKPRYENIFTSTKVTGIKAQKSGLKVSFEGNKAPESDTFDKVLVAVVRKPNGIQIAADNVCAEVDERGFIAVDKQQRTNVPHIFAIGDIVVQPMLAHKATHEGKVAAECIAGEKSAFDARVIPSVAYTDPEVAWVGVTEEQAKREGIDYEKASFPWAANGRALSLGADDGITKLLFDARTVPLIGGAIVGPHSGHLLS